MRKSKHRDGRPSARLDWEAVRVFAAVAAAGSVNKAAADLKIQPSNVSRKIDALEKRLEVKLFQRTRSGMILTDAGADLYDHARSMQRHADDIERSVRGRDRREEGMVTIAAPDGVAALWVAPRLPGFFNRHPKIQISLECLAGPAPADSDIRPDITIALDKSLAQIGDDATTLATMHYVFMAAPAYLDIYGTPKSIAAAAGDHRTIKHTGQVSQRETWSQRATAIEALAAFTFETNSSAGMVAALRAGAGVATVPTYLITHAPELVMIGQDNIPIKLWLIVSQEARNAQRVTRTAHWLKSIFDPKTNPWFRDEFVHPDEFEGELAENAPKRRGGKS